MQPEQTVAEMANEVLMRQAEAEAERSGEPIEEAMWAVVETEAGKHNSPVSGTAPRGGGRRGVAGGYGPGVCRGHWRALGRGPRAPHARLTGRTS